MIWSKSLCELKVGGENFSLWHFESTKHKKVTYNCNIVPSKLWFGVNKSVRDPTSPIKSIKIWSQDGIENVGWYISVFYKNVEKEICLDDYISMAHDALL